VPPDLEKICVRAMAREPAARYQRALEMAQDIQRWLDENPLTTTRKSTGLKAVLQTHAILIITLLLIVVLVLTTVLSLRGFKH